jgi:hypothetical protein
MGVLQHIPPDNGRNCCSARTVETCQNETRALQQEAFSAAPSGHVRFNLECVASKWSAYPPPQHDWLVWYIGDYLPSSIRGLPTTSCLKRGQRGPAPNDPLGLAGQLGQRPVGFRSGLCELLIRHAANACNLTLDLSTAVPLIQAGGKNDI